MERTTTRSVRGFSSQSWVIFLLASLTACSPGGGSVGGGGGGGTSPSIQSSSLPFGLVNQFYSQTLSATGGTAPYTWSIVGGSLATGLGLTPATGVVSGTPTATTTVPSAVVTVRVQDSTGQATTGAVTIAVHPLTDRVSVDNNGSAGNGTSITPFISTNGRLIVFESASSNLAPGVSGSHIYLHDRQTNQTSLVSRDNLGTPANAGSSNTAPVISQDGRFVAFVSTATNLVTGVTGQHVYLRDIQTNQTSLVSQSTAGFTGDGANSAPSVRGNGNFVTVAFVSSSTNLVAGISGQQIYVRDTQTNLTGLVSQNNLGTSANAGSSNTAPVISQDGRFVAFVSTATNLVTGVTGQHVYLRDIQTNQTSLVSQSTAGFTGDGANSAPSISSDGRYVAFVSSSTNLVPGISGQHIYVRDTQTPLTSLVSQSTGGTPGDGASSAPSVRGNGNFVTVAFVSSSTNLVPGISGQHIYVRDTQTPLTSLVSKDSAGTPANAGSSNTTPTISTNGSFIAFVSSATNLVTVAPVAPTDIYVRAIP